MIKEYLEYIEKVRGLRAATIEGYKKDLNEFVKYAMAKGLRWSTLTERDVDAWLADMSDRCISAATRNRRLAALRGLLTWAQHKGMLETNAARFCQQAKKADTLPKCINIESIDNYLRNRQPSVASNIAALQIAIMIESGMRIGEVLDIELKDIDPNKQSIKIAGKGGKERIVFYGERTKKELQSIVGAGADGKIFPDWSQQYYRQNIEEQLLPFTGKMNPHQLRHTFATDELNKGMPIETVSMLLGHKSIDTTQIYARVAVETARQQYQSINN